MLICILKELCILIIYQDLTHCYIALYCESYCMYALKTNGWRSLKISYFYAKVENVTQSKAEFKFGGRWHHKVGKSSVFAPDMRGQCAFILM